MPKATFETFLEESPPWRSLACNSDARRIFEILSRDDAIIAMMEYAEAGKPALSPCVPDIETFFDSLEHPTVDLRDSFFRQGIGCFVKSILKPLGYSPRAVNQQKGIPAESKARYFKSASCYERNPAITPTLRVIKKLEEIV